MGEPDESLGGASPPSEWLSLGLSRHGRALGEVTKEPAVCRARQTNQVGDDRPPSGTGDRETRRDGCIVPIERLAEPPAVMLPVLARRGGSVGRAFGHTRDGTAVVREEADAIRDAARRVLAGETLSSIIRSWNERGLQTATGGPWRVNSLSTLLLQPRLAGLSTDLRLPPSGVREPILDLDTYHRLLALHDSRRKGPRRPTRHYLLRGLLRCWRCGGRMRGMPSSHGPDLYVCPGPPHGGCSGTAMTADRADLAIRDLVLARLDSDELLAGAYDDVRSSQRVDRCQVTHQLAGYRQRLDDLGEMWALGQISRAEWMSVRASVIRRVKEMEAAEALIDRIEDLRRLAGTGSVVHERWPEMTTDERRGILLTALDHVVVLAAEPPRQVFQPERLRPFWVGLT